MENVKQELMDAAASAPGVVIMNFTLKHIAVTVMSGAVLMLALPVSAQTFKGDDKTITGIGDQINSGFDQIVFTGISNTFTGPGVYSIDNVTFNVGINATVAAPFDGTFLLTGNSGSFSYPVSYSGSISDADTITIGGNTIDASGYTVHFNTLILGPTDGSESGILTATISAAPEPGTWALMLGGVGMMGMVLRRRQKNGLRSPYA